MNVIKYLNEHGIEALKNDLHIFVKHYPESNLYVLNYCQIRSPRFHPVADECRGLILTESNGKWSVVCRAFNRFYNHGENPTADAKIDFSKCTVREKIDGSLIKIYRWNGKWEISTRGTAFAESEVSGWGITFRELVLQALDLTEDEFQKWAKDYLFTDCTLLLEVVSSANRVVVKYPNTTTYYLGEIGNFDGRLSTSCSDYDDFKEEWFRFNLPAKVNFYNMDDCISAAAALPNLKEGWVVYNEHNVPVCKVKNPAYVAAHRIRGEGLSPRRIAELVVMNEHSEYLAVFPEDEEHFRPYIDMQESIVTEMERVHNHLRGQEMEQKDFAMAINHLPYKSALFSAQARGIDVVDAYCEMRERHKQDILMNAVNEGDID